MPRRLSFGARLRGVWWKPDPAREVDDEFAHHLELLTREGMARGLSREDALTEATGAVRHLGGAAPGM